MISPNSIQVVIPYYKEFEYFKIALGSVLNQDYQDFTILVVDDGSGDLQLKPFIESLGDSRITLVQNIRNIGLAKNFEYARTLLSGDFVIFLGQDDILESNYISTIIPWVHQSESIVLIQPAVSIIDRNGTFYNPLADKVKYVLWRLAWLTGTKVDKGTSHGSLLSAKKAAFILLLGDFLYFPTLTWKRSAMSKFDTTKSISLDYQMIVDVLCNGGDLLLVSNMLAKYRRHAASASMKSESMISRLNEEKKFHEDLKAHPLICNSKALKLANSVRLTQRLHSFQVSFIALLQLRFKDFYSALRSGL